MMSPAPLWMLVLLGMTAALVWLGMVLLRGRPGAAASGPACGACGYSVVGLTTTTCPECGGDLRAVGILGPGARRHGPGLLASVLLFSALLAFVGIVVTPVLVSVLPMRRTYERTVRLVTPESGAYQEVVVRARGQSWGSQLWRLPVEIELVRSGPATQPAPPRLLLRPDGSFGLIPPPSAGADEPGAFAPAAVLAWMKSAGIDTLRQAVREEAARIAGEARLASRSGRRGLGGATAGGFSSSSSGGDSGGQFASNISTERADRRPPLWVLPLLALFWLGIWVCGFTYLVRRSRGRSQ